MTLRDKVKAFDEVYASESGLFYCLQGIVQKFEPTIVNLIEGGIDAPDADGFDRHYDPAVKTMIVPFGVKGFCDEFFRYGAVTEFLVLPESLESIGCPDNESIGCVFANCKLPEVIIPEKVKYLGIFCFGRSHIDKLLIREKNSSPYLRQFKDSRIGKVYLPHTFRTDPLDEKYGFYRNFEYHCECDIIEY